MKSGIIILFLTLLFANTVFADKFIVESFKADPSDLSARTEEMKDINGDVCAIIKVLSDIEGLKFDANVGITFQVYKQGAYWLYVSPGERQLKIMKEGFITLPYAIPVTIVSSNVYVMVLTNENKTQAFSNETARLTISSIPTGADISIDGIPTSMKTNDEVKAITVGKHKISLNMEDYEPFDTIVNVEKDITNSINKNLISLYSFVKFNITPGDAELFLDGQKESFKNGESNRYMKGNKVFEVKAPLYYPFKQELKTGGGGTKELNVALKPNFGSINISTGDIIGAEISLNGKPVAQVTPCTLQKIQSGKYSIRVVKKNYDIITDSIVVADEKETQLNYKLIPNTGSIAITSTPEPGAKIFIDNKDTDKKTPFTFTDIGRGKHTIVIKKDLFTTAAKDFEITGGENLEFNLNMEPLFGEITITAEPDADIKIDSTKVGNKLCNVRLPEGAHTIEIVKDKYYPVVQSVNIEIGKKENLNFTLKPKTGSITIETKPAGAEIFIDSKSYGLTPQTISDLLIGQYTLKFEKQGYGTISKTVEVKENQTTEIIETLPQGMQVNITTNPVGAKIKIDGGVAQSTPYTDIITFGTHTITAIPILSDYLEVSETITITQGGKTSYTIALKSKNNGTFTDNRDGKTYKWVKIGNQTWMAENLNYKTQSGSCCNDNNEQNCAIYGRLYNWETAKTSCPTGWHLPSDEEWMVLEMQIGIPKAELNIRDWRGDNIDQNPGGKLQSIDGWYSSPIGATNETGFNALPGGAMESDMTLRDEVGYDCFWWTASLIPEVFSNRSMEPAYRSLRFNWYAIYRGGEGDFNYNRFPYFSVRCIKDK